MNEQRYYKQYVDHGQPIILPICKDDVDESDAVDESTADIEITAANEIIVSEKWWSNWQSLPCYLQIDKLQALLDTSFKIIMKRTNDGMLERYTILELLFIAKNNALLNSIFGEEDA